MPRARNFRRLAFVAVVLTLLSAAPSRAANTIEIVSLSPSSPATLDAISPTVPFPGGAASASNTVTVVVRYTSDGEANTIEPFPDPPVTGGFRTSLVAPPGSVAACGALSGPSSGECAVAFTILCPADSTASVHVGHVGAALGIAAATMTTLATDRTETDYTFVCPGPPRHEVRNCMAFGVPGESGESELPIGSELPLCRCLRDDGAREFRCAFLNRDFLLLRRVPIPPLLAGHQGSEEWSLLPFTKLAGPIRLMLSGDGLAQRAEHVFGAETPPGVLERFSVPLDLSPGSTSLRGRGLVVYEGEGAGPARWRKFEFERDLDLGGYPPN